MSVTSDQLKTYHADCRYIYYRGSGYRGSGSNLKACNTLKSRQDVQFVFIKCSKV